MSTLESHSTDTPQDEQRALLYALIHEETEREVQCSVIAKAVRELLKRQDSWRQETGGKRASVRRKNTFALSWEDIEKMNAKYSFIRIERTNPPFMVGKGSPLVLWNGKTVFADVSEDKITFYYEPTKEEIRAEERQDFLRRGRLYPVQHTGELDESPLDFSDLLSLIGKGIISQKTLPKNSAIKATHMLRPRYQDDPVFFIVSEDETSVSIVHIQEDDDIQEESIVDIQADVDVQDEPEEIIEETPSEKIPETIQSSQRFEGLRNLVRRIRKSLGLSLSSE